MAYAITVIDGLRHEGICALVLLGKPCSCRRPFPIAWDDTTPSPSAGSAEAQANQDEGNRRNSAGLDAKDRVILDLLNALDVIQREATRDGGCLAYIDGAASQAVKMCKLRMSPNQDGYLVIKG